MNLLKNLDWRELITKLVSFATSEMAREKLRNTEPLASAELATKSFDQIEALSQAFKEGYRPRMESLDLYSNWYQRLTRNSILKILDIKDVRHFCIEALSLKEVCLKFDELYFKEIESEIMDAEAPIAAIDDIMTSDGEIRSDASDKLRSLNAEKNHLARQVQLALDRLVKDFQIEHLLQDKYVTTREGRWVLPIKSGMQHGFDGVIHDASQSKQTVFMEPKEILPINNRLRQIEIEIALEIERILIELSSYLKSLRFEFENTQKILLIADTQFAQSELATVLNASPCTFDSENFKLFDVRHPLLVFSSREVISNDLELNAEKRILILSGPNAGGKTVLLKSMGLAAQMARCGLPICARKDSALPFFKEIIVSIGDSQSVDSNMSTFAAHLTTLNSATKNRGPQSLLLIDEICGSTDPEEGAALARSFIDTYNKNKVFGVITSHLGALKHGWKSESGISFGSLEFDNHSGPTYKFISGISGKSLAIQTAERIGVSKEIIQCALANLSPEVRKFQEALGDIDKTKAQLIELQKQMNEEKKSYQNEKTRYENLIKKFNEEKELLLDKELRKANKKVEELIQLSQVSDVFKKHENLQKIKFELPKIIKSSDQVGGIRSTDGSPIVDSDNLDKTFFPGAAVHIISLDRDGVVQGAPNAKGEVPLVSNSMRLVVHWSDLKPKISFKNNNTQMLKKAGHISSALVESDRTVDLRGLTVEDALSQLQIQLDQAVIESEDRVKIIHGHGTDALKRAVRSYLSRSAYIKKWQVGTKESGGDGLTWAELK